MPRAVLRRGTLARFTARPVDFKYFGTRFAKARTGIIHTLRVLLILVTATGVRSGRHSVARATRLGRPRLLGASKRGAHSSAPPAGPVLARLALTAGAAATAAAATTLGRVRIDDREALAHQRV